MNLAPFLETEPAERKARLRSLRLASRLICGPRGTELERALHRAEHDPSALPRAAKLIEGLQPLDRRRLLSSWWGVTGRGKADA
jgi:hypothetical protein